MNFEVFFLILFIFLFNLILYLKFNNISQNFIFFDKPDGKLKRHSKPISLIGGLIILVNLFLITFFLKLLQIENSIFEGNYAYAVIILSTIYYLIGLIDDLKDLAPHTKLSLIVISTFIVIYLFPEISLQHFKISFLKTNYELKYSILFLVLSFALLSNSMNMFDGINLQLLLFTIFVFILFIFKGFFSLFFILLIICLSFLSVLNYKNKVYLGDGGAYLISSIIGCTFIYQYNNFSNSFFGDEVFIILIIPAIDMLRLFIVRILDKRHPFKGDLNHFHHIINNLTKNRKITVFFTLIASVLPTIFLFLNIKTYYILLITLIFYISIIQFSFQKK